MTTITSSGIDIPSINKHNAKDTLDADDVHCRHDGEDDALMNDVTRAWGRAVKGRAAVLALSLVALLVQLGHAFWQASAGTSPEDSEIPVMAQALHRLPVEARHLARLGRAALDGTETWEEFRNTRRQVNAHVQQLMAQMAAAPEWQARAQPLVGTWAEMETAAGRVHDNLDVIREMVARERQWFDQVEVFKARLDVLVREMVASGAAASQVYLALHQLVLLDEMSVRVERIRRGHEHAALDAAGLAQEIAAFTRVLTGLQRGDTEMALRRLQGRKTRTALAQVTAQWVPLRARLEEIAQQAPSWLLAHSAVLALERGADTVLVLAGELAQSVAASPPMAPSGIARQWAALGTGALSLLSGVGLWQALLRRRDYWNEQDARQRHREQEAFAQLLDEMGALAEGDLTIKATFSEGAAGALADAINFITRQLGARIQAMTDAATTITAKAGQVRSKAIQLSEVSQYQREELDAALVKVRQISTSVGALAAQMADEGESGPQVLRACADLAAMLDTVHTVTVRLAGEAAQAVSALDALAQSAADLRESANGFVLAR